MSVSARVGFRVATGRESTADLALVRVEQLVASRLELARLLLADFDPQMTAIAVQPFLVTAPSGGRMRRHVPDFLLSGRGGGVCVVNVKPADQLAVPKVAEALAWAGEVFAVRGDGMRSGRERRRRCWPTCGFLAGYRYPGRVDADLVTAVMDQAHEAVSIGELEGAWPGRGGEARAAVLHLVWRGVFRADLSVPLSAATMLKRAS